MRILLTLTTLVIATLTLFIVACKSHSPKENLVTFTVRNDSKHHLIWVKVNWPSGGVLSEGVISPGVFSSRLEYRWPEPPMPDFVLSFIEDGTEGNLIPGVGFDGKPTVYKINVPLEEVNKKIATGNVKKVLVRILDFDKAEISCE